MRDGTRQAGRPLRVAVDEDGGDGGDNDQTRFAVREEWVYELQRELIDLRSIEPARRLIYKSVNPHQHDLSNNKEKSNTNLTPSRQDVRILRIVFAFIWERELKNRQRAPPLPPPRISPAHKAVPRPRAHRRLRLRHTTNRIRVRIR